MKENSWLSQALQLTTEQTAAHHNGVGARQTLIDVTKDVAKRSNVECGIRGDFRIDTLITGSTGVGKTYWIKEALKKNDVPHEIIDGTNSLAAFAQKLMITHYTFMRMPNRPEKMVILLDDVSFFFQNQQTIDLLLAMTGDNRVFAYNKIVLEYQWDSRNLEIMRANYANPDGAPGFSIPCDDFIFIFTTNFKFPTDHQVEKYNAGNGGGGARGQKLASLAAVRRRFTTREFWLPKSIYWGWLYEVAMNDNLVTHESFVKSPYRDYIIHQAMQYMWNHWDNLREHNLDTVKEMIFIAIEKPHKYVEEWSSLLQPEFV
jgi:hypothetical protein